ALPGGSSEEIVIDPWITTVTTLAANNAGYDVDHDNAGNAFIYGGGNSSNIMKVAKYSAAGTLLWTFSGTITTPAWNTGGGWISGMTCDKVAGKIYIARRALGNIVRLDAAGNYDNFISTGLYQFNGEAGDITLLCNGNILHIGGAYVMGSSGTLPGSSN